MKLYEYESHDEYVAVQTAANKRKIDMVWVSEGNVRMVRNHFHLTPRSILCHGTRNAAEQKLFKTEWPDAFVIGSEISDSASWFPMTIQQDMQEPRLDWIRQFDIVYSNSFDHSCDPVGCLETWLGQLANGGRLYVDFADDPKVNYSSITDPLALDTGDMEKLTAYAGGRIITKMDGKGAKGHHTTIYVIGRRTPGSGCSGW